MIKSDDGMIEVLVGKTTGSVIFPPASWSVVNVPASESEAASLFNNLYNMPTHKHSMLALCRDRRKNRVQATKNLPSELWTYLETVAIFYEKPSTCSNNGLLPLSEPGWVFFKGPSPDTKKTSWFAEDYENATNLWNVAIQDGEPYQSAYFQKFNWETQLLMMSMSEPIETTRFIYMIPLDKNEQKSLFAFCKRYSLKVCLYAADEQEAAEVIQNYKKWRSKA